MSTEGDTLSSAILHRHPTWTTCSIVVFFAMGAGALLFILRPVWLAPPFLQYTWWMYIGLGLVWVVVLGACVLLRPTGNRRWPIILVSIGLLACVLSCLVSRPGVVLEALASGNLECDAGVVMGDQVRYTCTSMFYLTTYTYIFEGVAGSPVLRLVGYQIEDS